LIHRILVALCWALLLLVELQVLLSFSHRMPGAGYLAVCALVGPALLVAASNETEKAVFVPFSVAGAWLATLMLPGLSDAQEYLNWISSHGYGNSGWLGYVFVGLLISSVLILLSVSRRFVGHGLIWLTAYTGFLIIMINGVVGIIRGSGWETLFQISVEGASY